MGAYFFFVNRRRRVSGVLVLIGVASAGQQHGNQGDRKADGSKSAGWARKKANRHGISLVAVRRIGPGGCIAQSNGRPRPGVRKYLRGQVTVRPAIVTPTNEGRRCDRPNRPTPMAGSGKGH